MDETDRRFVGVLLFLASIAVIAGLQTPLGTACGVILWIVSLLWIAQPRPQTEESHEAYRKGGTPLDTPYRGNLVGPTKRRRS